MKEMAFVFGEKFMDQQNIPKQAPHVAFPVFIMKIASPLRKTLKQKHTPEDEQNFIKALKAIGMPEERIPHIFALINGMSEVNNPAENYLSDKIYVGGIGALDLILFQILASMGRMDWTSYLAWLALAISLPCAAGFLYVSFLKEKKQNPFYSPIHEKLALLSVIGGGLCAVATMWHFWFFSGITLLLFSVAVYGFCVLYRVFNTEDFKEAYILILNELSNEKTKVIDTEHEREK